MRWEALAAIALLLTAAPAAVADYVHDEDPPTGPTASGDEDQHPVDAYHTWETLTVDLQQLVSNNPGIARLHSAGESVLGLDLWLVEIANFRDENKTPLDERETVWLDGGTHANEQLGTELAYEWAEFLIEGYGENETATWIVDNRHTFILPLVNPDGNHVDSRQNARGVDLNRNYPVGWGALDEGRPPVGPGSYALSEPETRTIVDWWAKTEPDYVNSFHTGIELMLYPPGYEEADPADQQVYRRICEEIGEPDPEFCGPIHSTIYPASGGSIDTSYERFGSVSFAYEVTTEQGLYASIEDVRERLDRYWDGVEHAFLNVERYGAHPAIQDVSVADETVDVTIANEGYGDLARADVTIEVPGDASIEATLDELAAGNATTLSVELPVQAAEDGRVSLELAYPERQQAEPTETRTVDLPVRVEEGRLTVDADADEADLAAASVDETETNGVPGPGALVAALAVSLAAGVPRRR
ncbi:hypothetical protein BRD56_02275 [Thermoplasmatales archaeon SW_10_69_26]|nr:MAG: hypothetical protein BRD56_02275 [Thermoplasmatales archaeon SW_10_69_26]